MPNMMAQDFLKRFYGRSQGGGGSAPQQPMGAPQSGNALPPRVSSLNRTLGRYTDRALAEKRQNLRGAEGILQQQMADLGDDPLWSSARQIALSRARNPGIDPNIIARMRGRVQARNAAGQATEIRDVVSQLARRNIDGPAAASAVSLAKNRTRVRNNQNLLDVDMWAEEQKEAEIDRALSQLQSVASQYHGLKTSLARSLAALKTSNDPLNDLAKVQSLTALVGQLAQASATADGSKFQPAPLPKPKAQPKQEEPQEPVKDVKPMLTATNGSMPEVPSGDGYIVGPDGKKHWVHDLPTWRKR